ncbi:MAG: nitrous oxide reductase accessory protein NosL [Campylobacterota bacterium]|nr:nitrous oxide reductase accessory protein NosL [Campylobacterota bacterium]
MKQLLFILLITFTHGATWCPICGNDLHTHQATNHKASLHNGHPREYCSLRCMVVDAKEYGITHQKVRNYSDQKFIDVQKAWYVVGSKRKGIHSKISKIAFDKRENAIIFANKYGGAVEDFNSTWRGAKASLKLDDRYESMLKSKKIYPKGKRLYERKCKSFAIEINDFLEIDELKEHISSKQLCPKLNPKQFQTMALYLWEVKRNNILDAINNRIEVGKEEKCPVCGMFTYKYPRWAAQIVISHQNQKHHYSFDGVKDMMKFYFNPNKWGSYTMVNAKTIQKILVSDYYSQKAIDATQAFYVIGSDIYGPMGHELIPFENLEDAKTFKLDHHGKTIIEFGKITQVMTYELDK